MIYYPKANITPNLYSNGELSILDSNESYIGYYFSTYDGKYFTGKEPGDGPNLELTLNTVLSPDTHTDTQPQQSIDYRFLGSNFTYSTQKNIDPQSTSQGETPIQYFPNPTEEDYITGEITRYFAKKTNENIYYETQFLFQNSLYIGFFIPWAISGDKAKVEETNKKIVLLKEQELNIIGLGLYLKNNYLKYYK